MLCASGVPSDASEEALASQREWVLGEFRSRVILGVGVCDFVHVAEHANFAAVKPQRYLAPSLDESGGMRNQDDCLAARFEVLDGRQTFLGEELVANSKDFVQK